MKKIWIFFLIFFPRWSLGSAKIYLRSFFEKSQHKFESLLFPSGEFWNLHPLYHSAAPSRISIYIFEFIPVLKILIRGNTRHCWCHMVSPTLSLTKVDTLVRTQKVQVHLIKMKSRCLLSTYHLSVKLRIHREM